MNEEHFEVVVVGSGFGGSVCAYRLARAGLKVCLLERGQVYQPGSFPRTQYGLRRNFWDPSEGSYGLYNVWSFKGLDALITSGLGGGSLIYANVLLRKPKEWFDQHYAYKGGQEHWPITYADLQPHYEAVETMLNAQQYPLEREPYNRTHKTIALKEAADRLNLPWGLVNLAVTFANPGEPPIPGEPIVEDRPNLHGRTRYTCRLCGECVVGCNYGSKNTLDYNYLSRAAEEGVDIRTLCEVRSFGPREDNGYFVRYVKHDPARAGQKTETSALSPLEITTDRLILCAGTLGTTYLLLKNRHAFPRLSPQLGTHFSGNGDLLTFALKCKAGEGDRSSPRNLDPSFGPSITSAIKIDDDPNDPARRGYFIEDAGIPAFATWIIEAFNLPHPFLRVIRTAFRRLLARLKQEPTTDISGEIASIFGNAGLSSSSIPILGQGRDTPDGNMTLRDNFLQVDWTIDSSAPYFSRLRQTMREITRSWACNFVDNPAYFFKRVITVHPLGGCPMGQSVADGVVDSYGEVFNYPGFYVADGSVMPGPTGSNPALTIAAFADRCAENIIRQDQAGSPTE
jgi:cholesterol oxidase